MENASKALIMAAGVLIGIGIISLAVYLIVTFGGASANAHKQRDEQQLEQFNNQFLVYEDKEDITIYDVISIANLATENNKYYEFKTMSTGQRPNNDKVSNNYIWVTLENHVYHSGKIDISYGTDKGNDHINGKYNELVKKELNRINNSSSKLYKYNCKVYISSITGRVYRVDFVQKS